MLSALMRLFAILSNINRDVAYLLSRNFVESYLKTQFNRKVVDKSLDIFDNQVRALTTLEGMKETKRISALSVKILTICNQINNELHIKSKYLILLGLIRFLKYFDDQADPDEEFRQTLSDTVFTISEYLQINKEEYDNCRIFITDKFYKIPQKENLLVISNIDSFSFAEINHIQKENLQGQLFFLKIQQAGIILFYYAGTGSLELGGKYVFPHHTYIFPKGSALRGGNISPVYYSDIESGFLKKKIPDNISFFAREVDFSFPDSDNGIHKFSFSAEAGELTGIMGGSGVGKSTLIKVFNGIHKPDHGDIFINGHELQSRRNELKGMIAYVPQDDLLIEELTVYQNLYFKARLCLGNLDDLKIHETIIRVLNNLDLFYIKDLIVGTPMNKLISGGQRKRLNIALELIIEPYILFADEPTSGLSSTDAENVMQLLNELCKQGKIVFINIHQPSSELFKMLDKIILLDKGGYPVYTGNPMDSFTYLINITKRVDSEDIECSFCGNVQPDEIMKIIESKHVNEFGEYTEERVIPPRKWYELFLENIQSSEPVGPILRSKIPAIKFNLPGRFSQFITYSIRNLFAKISDKQYILLASLIAPLLALLVSSFTKYFSGSDAGNPVYLFSQNVNIPAYIFMSVIVALFIGLVISAEEIIKDRKTLEREQFLSLSKTAYFNSKILFLFVLSALQMMIYVLLGNYILEIKGLSINYWIILFSTSCFAVMLGLNISSAFKTVVSIYINIPFILVPLILLSGVIVKYDKLHHRLASDEYVPVVGDLMASRWAYEALMVTQFRDNNYQKLFYPVDRESANISWQLNFMIPALNNKINDYESLISRESDSENLKKSEKFIERTINELKSENTGYLPYPAVNLSPHSLNLPELKSFVRNWRSILIKESNDLTKQKDEIFDNLLRRGMSSMDIVLLKERYYNKSVADLVLNQHEMVKIIEHDGKFIRKDTPVYQTPSSGYGRAQFYSGTKRIGHRNMDTLWFNVAVLWFMTSLLYISLIYNVFGRIMNKVYYFCKNLRCAFCR